MSRNISKSVAIIATAGALFCAELQSANATDAAGHTSSRDLARLVRACAPRIDRTTQSAIVAVESGGSAWAVHDDNDGRVYAPATYDTARILVETLVARDEIVFGHLNRGVDVGLAQINSTNFASMGVTAADMLEPCRNLKASAIILENAYVRERSLLANRAGWRGDEVALQRALQVYNSGRSSGDDAYVRAVYATLAGFLVRGVASTIVATPEIVRSRRLIFPVGQLQQVASRKLFPTQAHGTMFYHASISGKSQIGSAPLSSNASRFVHVDIGVTRTRGLRTVLPRTST